MASIRHMTAPHNKLNTQNFTFPSEGGEESSGQIRGNSRAKNQKATSNFLNDRSTRRGRDVRPKEYSATDDDNKQQTKGRKEVQRKQTRKITNDRKSSVDADTVSIKSTITFPANHETSSVAGKRSTVSMTVSLFKATKDKLAKGVGKIIPGSRKKGQRSPQEDLLNDQVGTVSVEQNIKLSGMQRGKSSQVKNGSTIGGAQKYSETDESDVSVFADDDITDTENMTHCQAGNVSSNYIPKGDGKRPSTSSTTRSKTPNVSTLRSLFQEVAILGATKWKKIVEKLLHGLPDSYAEDQLKYFSGLKKGDAKSKLETFLFYWYDYLTESQQVNIEVDNILTQVLQDVLQKPTLVLAFGNKVKTETEGVLEPGYLEYLLRYCDIKPDEYSTIQRELRISHDDEERINGGRLGSQDVTLSTTRLVKFWREREDKMASDLLLKGRLLRAFQAAGREDIVKKLAGNKAPR